jgi:hypothetical protein
MKLVIFILLALFCAGSAQGAVVDLSVVNGQITVTDASNYIGTVTGDILPVQAGNWYMVCQSKLTGAILGEKYGTGGGLVAFKNIPLEGGINLEIYPAPEDLDLDPSNNRLFIEFTPTKQEVDFGLIDFSVNSSAVVGKVTGEGACQISVNIDGSQVDPISMIAPGNFFLNLPEGAELVYLTISPGGDVVDPNPGNDVWTGTVPKPEPEMQDLTLTVTSPCENGKVGISISRIDAGDMQEATLQIQRAGEDWTDLEYLGISVAGPIIRTVDLSYAGADPGDYSTKVRVVSPIEDPNEANNGETVSFTIATPEDPEQQLKIVSAEHSVEQSCRNFYDVFYVKADLTGLSKAVLLTSYDGQKYTRVGSYCSPKGYKCTIQNYLPETKKSGEHTIYFKMVSEDGKVESNIWQETFTISDLSIVKVEKNPKKKGQYNLYFRVADGQPVPKDFSLQIKLCNGKIVTVGSKYLSAGNGLYYTQFTPPNYGVKSGKYYEVGIVSSSDRNNSNNWKKLKC